MSSDDFIDPHFLARVEAALRAELPDETLDPDVVERLSRALALDQGYFDAAHAARLYQLYRMAEEGSEPGEDGPTTSAEVTLPAAVAAPTLPGYTELTPVGHGGYSSCNSYRAVEIETGNRVLIQHFRPEHPGRDELLNFFSVGARELHPHLLRLKQQGIIDTDDSLYLVFDDPKGVRLSDFLRDSGPLSVALACGYTRQAALALQAIHEDGHVHLDVKPGNFLVGTNEQRLWLADYDLVCYRQTALAGGLEGTIAGTPAYMAPEQARGIEQTDARTDLYSLGCTLYEMLTGRQLFTFPSAHDSVRSAAERTGFPNLDDCFTSS